MKAFRGEILCVPEAPAIAGAEAIRHFADGLLVVEDGMVVARGAHADLAEHFAGVETESLPGLIVPGFVDAHVHYPQTERIASHGEHLLHRLERHIFPAEAGFSDRSHADAIAAVFLDELLRNGTTSALAFATVHACSVDALFDAALQRNMRIVSGKVLMDQGPETLRDTVADGRADTEALIARWRGRGRLGYAVTPRFALTSSDAQLADAGDLIAKHPDVLMHTHLSVFLGVYDRFGLVGPRAVFAHCVHMSDAALARMAEAGAGMALCPTSNLFLGSGLFDLAQLDRHGVPIGIGTDIGAGTSFSVLHTLGEAYKLCQLRGACLAPFRALPLATAGGARVMGLADRVGGLAPGQAADFVELDAAATPLLARRTAGTDLIARLI